MKFPEPIRAALVAATSEAEVAKQEAAFSQEDGVGMFEIDGKNPAAGRLLSLLKAIERDVERERKNKMHPRFVGLVEGGGLAFRDSAASPFVKIHSPEGVLARADLFDALVYQQQEFGAFQWGLTRAFLGRTIEQTINAALAGEDGAQKVSDLFAAARAAVAGFLTAHKQKREDLAAQAKKAEEEARKAAAAAPATEAKESPVNAEAGAASDTEAPKQ
jgi:hypothetical protein